MPKDYRTKADEAQERKELRDARTPQQQIAVLDKKFGAGLGAKKERAKLLKLINKG